MPTRRALLLLLPALLPGLALGLPFQVRDPAQAAGLERPEATFGRSDLDQSGGLSFDEFLHTDLPYVQLKREEFDGLDADHDGTVSKAEYSTHAQREQQSISDLRAEYFGQLYEQFDRDFDLKLSEQEVRQVLAQRFQLRPRPNFARIFAGFDRDGDGGLDLGEYVRFDAEMPFYELDPLDAAEQVPEKPEGLPRKQEKLPGQKLTA